MLSADSKAKRFFTKKNANKTRGAFKQNTAILCGMAPFVAILIRMAIPDTPPIVKLLGAIKEYAEKELSPTTVSTGKQELRNYVFPHIPENGKFVLKANNKNFRDELILSRNTLEDYQWQLYLIAKAKSYYIPAAPAGQADIDQVKSTME